MSVRHVAIIMDGNGRWAKARGKVRTEGHFRGVEVVRDAAIAANDLGIEVLTLYAFSTENWKRSAEEVGYLMKLPAVFFNRFLKELMEKNIRIAMIGEMDQIPAETAKILQSAMDETRNNTGMVLNFAMNYGSQREIVLAARKYAEDVKNGVRENDLEVNQFDQYLMTSEFPPLDLMIRTSGECRISNFLLWQLAYTELYFTKTLWPDFGRADIQKAVETFYGRHRRFGGL